MVLVKLLDSDSRLEIVKADEFDERLDAIEASQLELTEKAKEIEDAMKGFKEEFQFFKKSHSLHNLLLQGNTNVAKPPSLTMRYDGNWDNKSLEDLLWDVDELLSSTKDMADDVQLKQVTTCFTSSAKLWWRTNLGDV